ncbi:MAG: ABC transporter substrate-binding protein [Thermodesulfobacteriota bacterium]|nr:ABC transporter substrate-binding protein [Thermodesulfobacteriota bacterium]
MRRFLFLGSAFLTIFLLATLSYAQPKPVSGGSLTIAQGVEPPGLDPTTATSAAIPRVVYGNVLEGLVRIDRDGKIIPALAREYKISKDGKEYTFILKKGVKFHDGKPFDAEDVKFTFERLMDPKTNIPNIKYYRDIESVEVADSHTVKFKLKNINSMFLFNLARPDSIIINKQTADRLKTAPVGTGPFKLVEWVRGDRVILAKFEEYHQKGFPYLDKVTFKFIGDPSAQIASLKAGDVDVIGYDVSPENALLLEKDPKFKVLNGYTTTEVILSTNQTRKPFDDVRVRRAMVHAIDRSALIKGAMSGYGTPIGSHMDPGNPYYIDLTSAYPYNPTKAKQLLAEAGYPNGFEAVIKLPERFAYAKRSGEIITDMLSQVGIRLKIELTEWGQWIDRVFKNADFDLTVIGHSEPFDIDIYANPKYYFRYDNPKFQETLKKAEMEPDPKLRRDLYVALQKMITEDAVNGFLFVMPSLPTMKKEVMNWWKDYPMTAQDVMEVWIQK